MAETSLDWENRIGRRLRLRDLHILSTVVHWGSMAKAARHLRMSQPSISEALAGLEAALGVRLLDRGPRGVEPTIYAQALLKRGLVVFDELQQGVRDIEFLADPTRGQVRIGCPESLMAGYVPAIIDRLSHDHPHVVTKVVHASASQLKMRELRERQIDVMLGRTWGPVIDDELEGEVLFKDAHFVVAGRQNSWIRRRKIELSELLNERWIHMLPDSDAGSRIAEAFDAHGLKVPLDSAASLTPSMHIRTHLLATGRFLTIMPYSMLHFNRAAWSLKALRVDLRIRPSFVAVVRLKSRTLSPVVERFVDYARLIAKSINMRVG